MIEFLLEPTNFQEYLARTVVGWVPMLGDAYTHAYLNNPRIKPVQGVHRARLESGEERHRRHRLLRAERARARRSSRPTSRSRSATGSWSTRPVARRVMEWAVETIKAAL